jgi:hypothetical protein
MTTTDKILYASNATITCTLASLTSSATVGRGCAAVDNSSNLYVDAILTIAVKTSGSALANDKACYVYLYGCGADGIYNGGSDENVGTDASVTVDSPTNLKGPYVIACPSISTTYRLVVASVAEAFGGILPYKWGFVLVNFTGQNLDATSGNFTVDYTGVNFTNG